MRRTFVALLAALALTQVAPAVEPPKDTSAAAFTRTKKLKGKVTVDFKNEFLKEAMKELGSQLEDNKLGALSVQYGTGVSQNTRISYAGKDVSAEEALDGILKQLELGYHVVSKEKDRYDGWIEVTKGTHRGYPPGVDGPKTTPVGTKPEDPKKPDPKKEDPKKPVEPKKEEPKKDPSTEPDEKEALPRLDEAKKLIEMNKDADAKPLLKYLLKRYPMTKAAVEAKELLEKIK